MDVLVVYATKNGSTAEVAAAVADRLRSSGMGARLAEARTVRSPVSGCGLVVVGAPLYSGRWHRHAHRFLRRHRRELSGVPVAVFGMGPRTDTEESWRRSRSQLERALAKHGWLTPVAVMVFGGVDPPGKSRRARRDLRDWDAIRAWADRCMATARQEAGAKSAGDRAAPLVRPADPGDSR